TTLDRQSGSCPLRLHLKMPAVAIGTAAQSDQPIAPPVLDAAMHIADQRYRSEGNPHVHCDIDLQCITVLTERDHVIADVRTLTHDSKRERIACRRQQ